MDLLIYILLYYLNQSHCFAWTLKYLGDYLISTEE